MAIEPSVIVPVFFAAQHRHAAEVLDRAEPVDDDRVAGSSRQAGGQAARVTAMPWTGFRLGARPPLTMA